MRALETTLEVKGLSIERMIARAAAEGFSLYGVERTGAREVRLRIDVKSEQAFIQYLTESGYGVRRVREAGAQRAMRLLKRRAMFSVGAALFCVALFAFSQCVWRIEITGAGATAGEVRRILSLSQVRPGRPKALIALKTVQDEIERTLPQVKYVDVRVRGVTLTVFCALSDTPQEAYYGGETGDVVARKDGIITQMLVRSGTPLVKVGDAVYAGQVLVRGTERVSREESHAVAAHAQVTARTFYQGAAQVSAYTLTTHATGREQCRSIIRTPWKDFSRTPRASYAMMDVEEKTTPIGGGFFPVTLVWERAIEVEGEKKAREKETLEAESAQIAEQIARRNVPIDAEVVDKWVDYSMIEEGFCAQVVLSCEEEIAVRRESAPEDNLSAPDA